MNIIPIETVDPEIKEKKAKEKNLEHSEANNEHSEANTELRVQKNLELKQLK